MIKRLYVDNYKSLVNFDCEFKAINLLLGVNGAGKSTVLDVLGRLRSVVAGDSPVSGFDASTLTRWQKLNLQTFEIEIEGNGGLYAYHLEIEHQPLEQKNRIKMERISYDGKPLYRSELGEVQLFHDDHKEGPALSGDWSRSGLPFLGERPDNTKITWLKNWFAEKLICLRIDPFGMDNVARGPELSLDDHASNFVGWYRQRVSTDMGATIALYDLLKEMYDEFGGLTLEQRGSDVQQLCVSLGVVENASGKREFAKYSFDELSEGERCLIVLYALLRMLGDADVTVCIDEPDNFLALAEIQPWLLAVKEAVHSSSSQTLVISHHPELIDYLAPECGIVFERANNGPTRARAFPSDSTDSSLSPSEVIARGWQ